MRFLMLHFISSPRGARGDSNWRELMNIARYSPEHYFIMPVPPEVVESVGYVPPNMELVVDPAEGTRESYRLAMDFPIQTLLNIVPETGNWPIDAVITSRIPVAPYVARYTVGRRWQNGVPVIIWEPKVVAEDDWHGGYYEKDAACRAFAYYNCFNVFGSEREMWLGIKESKKYVSAWCVEEIKKHSKVFPPGVDILNVRKHTKDVKKALTFTMLFSGRASSNKRFLFIVEQMRNFMATGRDVECRTNGGLLHSVKGMGPPPEPLRPEIRMTQNLPWSEYLKLLASSHVVVNASPVEGITIAVLEQLMAGTPVALPVTGWARALLREAWDTYPAQYQGAMGLHDLLVEMYDDYQPFVTGLKPVQRMIKEYYELAAVNARFMEQCKVWLAPEQEEAAFASSDIDDLFHEAMDGVPDTEAIDFTLLCERVKPRAAVPDMMFKTGQHASFVSKRTFYYWLRKNGWRDTFDSAVPKLLPPEKKP